MYYYNMFYELNVNDTSHRYITPIHTSNTARDTS